MTHVHGRGDCVDDSILITLRIVSGNESEDSYYDPQLIMYANSIFQALCQMGIGPEKGFQISDEGAVWTDFTNDSTMPFVRNYVSDKTRLRFDPPANSVLMEALKDSIAEAEWRARVENDLNKAANQNGAF